MPIIFRRNLLITGTNNAGDYARVDVPGNRTWIAWCGISFIYPTDGFTHQSYVVIDLFQHRKKQFAGDNQLPNAYWRPPFAWGGDFLGYGNVHNPRTPAGFATISSGDAGPYGSILNFRLYTNHFHGREAAAGGFAIVYAFDPS